MKQLKATEIEILSLIVFMVKAFYMFYTQPLTTVWFLGTLLNVSDFMSVDGNKATTEVNNNKRGKMAAQ